MITRIIYKIIPIIAANAFGIYKIKYDGSNRYFENKSGEWIGPFKEYSLWNPEPLLVIDGECMPELCNEFQTLGFSPDYVARAKGELEATKEHLKDMRKLVFEPTIHEVREIK